MVEFWPFAIVGALAVAAAVLMLLSENAIHSALFLIVTMGCIAFLFLLLNAPFLAMIQITVYAGAIMVLFLFVIMLLGAERILPADPGAGTRRFRWFTPAAVVLAVALLFAIGTPLLVGEQEPVPPQPPQVRVVNALTDEGIVDVYADGELIASGLNFGASSTFVEVPEGSHAVSVVPGGADAASASAAATTVTLEPGTTTTLVTHGELGSAVVEVVSDDISSVPDRSTRVTIYNAEPEGPAVSLVDFGSPLVVDDTVVLIDNVAPGARSESIIVPEGTSEWAIVDASNHDTVLDELPAYELRRDTTELFVVSTQQAGDGSVRTVAIPVVTSALAAFGSPRAIGHELFTTYMLPFQALAMLLLAAMVGVIVLTHRETSKRRQAVGRRRVSRPLTNVISAQVGADVTQASGAPAQLPGAETAGK